MVYGRVLRPPSYGATLVSADLAPAEGMTGVKAVRDGAFVGVTASTSHAAHAALEAIAKTAQWQATPHPSSRQLYAHLRERARGGVPANPCAAALANAQHAPMEPRAAVAEWENGKLTEPIRALRFSVAHRILPGSGRHREHLRPRVFHG